MSTFNSLSLYLVQDLSLGKVSPKRNSLPISIALIRRPTTTLTKTFPEVVLDSIQLTTEISHQWSLWGFFLIALA